VEDPALAGLRLSAAGLAGSAAHPPLRGSATETPAHRAAHKPTMRLFQHPRPADDRQNQGLAPAKEATAKCLCGIGQGGSCRPVNPALALAEPVRKCARGPPRQNAAPSRARHQTGGKSASSAPIICSGLIGRTCAMRSSPTGRDAKAARCSETRTDGVREIERGAGLPAGVLCFRPHSRPTI
jgi:hypothetical protein